MRVLQPPGGGSSNIFGDAPAQSAPAAAAAANRPSNKPTDAGIFGATGQSAQGGAQRTARDGDDSFNRLFGDSAASLAHSQKGASASQRVSTHSILFGNAGDSNPPQPTCQAPMDVPNGPPSPPLTGPPSLPQKGPPRVNTQAEEGVGSMGGH
ncbi:hypothetical protein ACOMHN_045446 [Nucella lapillus]